MGTAALDGRREPVASFRKPSLPIQPIVIPATSDDFNEPSLGLQWQWQANSDKNWYSLSQRPGWLRLFAYPVADDDLLMAPHLLLQKIPAREFTVETNLQISGTVQAGLVLTGKLPSSLIVAEHQDEWELTVRVKQVIAKRITFPKAPTLRLLLHLRTGGECQFAYDVGKGIATIGPAFQAEKGFWIGAKVGLFAMGDKGQADIDYFRFSPLGKTTAPERK
jgi:beta-xylosidase